MFLNLSMSEESVGLNIITEMKKKYKIPVGFSDHYLGCEAGFTASGATVIKNILLFQKNAWIRRTFCNGTTGI